MSADTERAFRLMLIYLQRADREHAELEEAIPDLIAELYALGDEYGTDSYPLLAATVRGLADQARGLPAGGRVVSALQNAADELERAAGELRRLTG